MGRELGVEIARLNALLGRELGRRADGHSIFVWKNSDDLLWPAHQTGRKIARKVEMRVPILGTSDTALAVETVAVPEYVSAHQMRERGVWVVAKWLTPEELIWGWSDRRHGGTPDEDRRLEEIRPTQAGLEEIWQKRFPGAEFPSKGWRIPTDATLPRGPGMSSVPTEADTLFFIERVKDQTSMGARERLMDMLQAEDRVQAVKDKLIQDEVRDCFPAFLSPKAGSRGGFVSFPWSKKDRL